MNEPKQLAGVTLEFLERVPLEGREVDAYAACRELLRDIATGRQELVNNPAKQDA